jgi:serine/threonine-protein kinase
MPVVSRTDPDATLGTPDAQPAPQEPIADEEEIAPGARIGEYVVLRLMACGGHGSVYLAEHRVLGRRAALKVMHRRAAALENMVARFVLEAKVVNRIRHPSIVDVYDIGTLPDGRPYCVMELLAGTSLRDLLARRGRLSAEEALAYLEPACAALAAAHAAGVVHRDVKASNLMVDEGPPLRVTLLDFGVAKAPEAGQAGLTAAGQRLGTSACMAPEQIRGEAVDPRTDVYALGVLLHQLVTGELPFLADDGAALEEMHLSAPPPRPSDRGVHPALDPVVARCLAKGPGDRFPSVAAFLSALRRALGAPEPAGTGLVPAVAVHASAEPADPSSDEGLLAAADLVTALEARLRAAGFAIPVSIPGACLAVRALPEGAGAARASRAEAIALARAAHAEAVAGAAGRPLRVRVAVHADLARLREGPDGTEVLGGPVCDTARWAPAADGFLATPQAAAGLDAPA